MMHGMTDDPKPPLIVAVSGGVDSVVLLHMLLEQKHPLIVAHVDHGIRPESKHDQTFVRQLAAHYDVPFLTTELHLGPSTSEETARTARYQWLKTLQHERAG